MSSATLDRLMTVMREVDGTAWEPLRNGLVATGARAMDLAYAAERLGSSRPLLHPLSRLIGAQVGDPFRRWDLTDIPVFREQFEQMLGYLPRHTSCLITQNPVALSCGRVDVRRFVPDRHRDGVRVVFLHGGGFVLGSLASNDPECDEIARGTGREVLSLGYPRSPEAKFPSALEHVGEALSREELLGGRDFVLVGESAGANLALAAIQTDPELRRRCLGTVLAYPFLDLTLSGRSATEYADGYFLTRELLRWFADAYLEPGSGRGDPQVSPLFGDLTGLPPSLVVVGEFDPLRSDAERLAAGSNRVRLRTFPGMLHGFLQLRGLCTARERALRDIVAFVDSLRPGVAGRVL